MQTFHTFTNAIEECRDSPKVDNFLSYPLYSNIIPHLEKIVGRGYNSQKLIISDWKPIFLSKKEGTASFKDMLMTIENKTSLFFIFEGTSKKIGDSCYFGIYNRNAVYHKDEQYLTNASDDHFCFATLGKNEYYCFQMKEDKPVIDFKNVKAGEVNFAQGFINLKHKVSLSRIGMISKDSHSEIQISKGYAPLQDFKIEKFTIYELGGMKENNSNSVSQNSQANPIQPLYNNLMEKYYQTESLNYFKENCFFVAENQTLEELSYDLFGFNSRMATRYNGGKLDEIYKRHKEMGAKDNILDLTLSFDEFVDKATTKLTQNKSIKANSSKKYIPHMGIFNMFEKENGVTELISITQKSVEDTWKNKELSMKWGLWLLELQSFTKLPLFFQFFMKDKHFKDLLFEILAGVPDQETGNSQHWSEKQVEAVKQTYKIIKEMFQASKDKTIRDKAAENGLIEKILIRLKEVTGEISRTYEEEDKTEEGEDDLSETTVTTVENEDNDGKEKKDKNNEEKKKVKNYEKKKRKGVGYTTGVGKTWNVSQYIKNKKVKNEQISYLIEILANFFRTKDWEPDKDIVDDILVS